MDITMQCRVTIEWDIIGHRFKVNPIPLVSHAIRYYSHSHPNNTTLMKLHKTV